MKKLLQTKRKYNIVITHENPPKRQNKKICLFLVDKYIVQLYNICMKITDMPEWVLKYKKKGYTIHKNGNSYALYKATSVYVPNSHPKTILTYVGIITEEGLKQKKEVPGTSHNYVEYGLSSFLYDHFHRDLQRTIFNSSKEKTRPVILLAIVKYIHGTVSDVAISSSHIASKEFELLKKIRESTSERRIDVLVGKLDELMRATFKEDVEDVKILLRLVVIEEDVIIPQYSDKIKELMEKHEVKL